MVFSELYLHEILEGLLNLHTCNLKVRLLNCFFARSIFLTVTVELCAFSQRMLQLDSSLVGSKNILAISSLIQNFVIILTYHIFS